MAPLVRTGGSRHTGLAAPPHHNIQPYTKSGYSGKFPVLPPRGYYNIGDGYETLTEYNTQVKRVQYLLNWAIGSKLTIDGKYGEKTSEAVKKLQEKAKTDKNGKFGNVCLAYARKIKK